MRQQHGLARGSMQRCSRGLALAAGTAMGLWIAPTAGAQLLDSASESPTDTGRAYAAELSADAALRSSQLRGGMGGESGGLSLIREGDTSVKLGGLAQFRYLMNFRQNPGNSPSGHDSGFTNGFEATRTRLIASGNVGNKDLTFLFETEFTRDGSATLIDAWGRYALDNRTGVTWGQFQLPILRDDILRPSKQLTVNNSIVAEAFFPGYSQGVMLDWRGQHIGAYLSLNDGLRASNTDYRSTGESDVAFTGRFEYMFGKDWSRFDDFTSWRGASNTWVLSGSFHWQTAGNTAASASMVQQQVTVLTAEAAYEGNGWNAYAAALYQITAPYHGGSELEDYGLVVQGGYFVTDNVEAFGRWDGIFSDSAYGPGLNGDLNTFTFGANWYLFPQSHAAKITGDVQWTVNEASQSAPVAGILAGNNVGLLPSNEDNQVALRLQFQLLF